MTNHFKKPATQVPLKNEVLDKLNAPVARKPANLGFWKERELRKAQRAAMLDDEKTKLAIDSAEAIATYEYGMALQGVAARTALGRVYGEMIAAEMSAMTECHSATVMAQHSTRMSASMVNLLAKNEHIAEVKRQHAAGAISTDDAAAMINTVIDLHIHSEDRIDGMYHETAQTTDRVFQGGFAPVNRRVGHGA